MTELSDPEAMLTQHSNDIVELLDSLNIEKVSLLGWDLGSAHAITTLSKHPQRVQSCHLLSGYPPLYNLSQEAEAALSTNDKSSRAWAEK